MPSMSKVTILVEPLDGSRGYVVEIPRITEIEVQPRYEEVEDFNPNPFTVRQQRMVGINIEIGVVVDEQTGVGYRVAER